MVIGSHDFPCFFRLETLLFRSLIGDRLLFKVLYLTRARARFLAIFQIWLWEQLETCKLATHELPDLRLTYILFTAMEDGFVSCLFLHSFAEIIKLNKNKTSIALLKKLACTNCQNTECINLRQFKIHTLYVVVLDGTILASLSMLNDIKWKWSTVLTNTISTLARYGLP
jgi:hypothetical protein